MNFWGPSDVHFTIVLMSSCLTAFSRWQVRSTLQVEIWSHVSELPIQLRDNLAYSLGDGLSIDEKLPILSLDYTIELAIGAIILQYVD